MLLCTNKTVYCEAGSLLYQNRFNFTMAGPGDVSSFLEKIGRNNAAYIQHIHVEFPSFVFSNPESDNVTLEEDDCSILTSIQSSCTNLRTLTTSRSSTSAMEFRLKALDDPKIVTEVLTLVDTRFRAISFLQDIILEAYKQGPSDYIRRQIKNHGWTVVPTGDAGSVGQDFGLYGLGYPRFLAKLGDDSDHGNYDYEYDGDF